MSFLINWDLLADGAEADGLREFLNARFSTITRPSFLGPLKVTELDFGDVPPEVAVTDICDPAAEFYLPDDPEIWRPSTPPAAPSVAGIDLEEGSGSATLVQHDQNADFADPSCDHEIAAEYAATMRRASDAQVEFEIVYKGNMRLAIQTELIVNQPTPAFMVLPLLLTLTGFQFTASALISYLGDRINFCFKESDAGTTILQDVSIDSEVGDGRKQGVLKNVGRIERFIVEQLRKVIQDFLVFPNHHSLKLLQDPVRNNKSDQSLFGDGGSEDFDDGMSYDPPI
ncbi:hypothetical protein BDZ88DRAFT_494034 [Geranomyces variabilis]|nr:hypothetical protein BDZ88DRAFT_494034 [Geranomyces variabilis]